MRLVDKVAVVTGSASGIGQATAGRFALEGARVFGLDLNGNPPCDVASAADVDAAAARVRDAASRVDVLVHAAGVSPFGATLDTAIEEFERVWHTNFLSAVHLVKAFTPLMPGGASIVFVSSINAITGAPGLAAYSAAKGALLTFGRTLALEFAPRRIRVNTVCPASIDTPMLQSSFNRQLDPSAARERNILRHPVGRLGTPDDVANMILFLASDEASWVTGGTHLVDGGALINRS